MAGLGIGTKFVCFLFCFINFFVWFLGCLVLAVGIFVRVEAKPWRDLVDLDLAQPANLLIAAGAFVMILGFLACCGACCKLKGCLICYSVFVILVVVLELAAGTYAYLRREHVAKQLSGALENGVRMHYARSDHASMSITIVLDLFHKKIKCCGAMGPDDFRYSYWQNNSGHHKDVPDSCCRKRVDGCNVNVTLYHKENVTYTIERHESFNASVPVACNSSVNGSLNSSENRTYDGSVNGTSDSSVNGTYVGSVNGTTNGTLDCSANVTLWKTVLKNLTKEITVHTYNSSRIYVYGCVQLGVMWAEKHILVLRNVGIGIGVTELVGILAALCLRYKFKHVKKGKRK